VRISFDLDDTLICYQPGVPCEPGRVPWLFRSWFNEPLRHGAVALMRELAADGWEVCVYTTSYRSPSTVRWWLWWYGVRVRLVVNQDVHDRYLRRHRDDHPPSKNPRAFGISLHVDDSEGVAIEGRQYGFAVVVVSPEDDRWTDKVRAVAARLRPSRRTTV
jgi:hypothetical protein